MSVANCCWFVAVHVAGLPRTGVGSNMLLNTELPWTCVIVAMTLSLVSCLSKVCSQIHLVTLTESWQAYCS